MKQVFPYVRAKCKVCNTPLDGDNVLRRGDNYYCPTHYETTSSEEILETKFQELKKKKYDKVFK